MPPGAGQKVATARSPAPVLCWWSVQPLVCILESWASWKAPLHTTMAMFGKKFSGRESGSHAVHPPGRPHFSHCLSVTLTVSSLSVQQYRPGIRSQFTVKQPSSRSMGCFCKNKCVKNTTGCIPARKESATSSKVLILLSVELVSRYRLPRAGGHFLSISIKSNNPKNYGDLVPDTRPRKKNHEAAGSRQLTLVDTNALLYDLITRRENQQRAENRILSYEN